MGYDPRYERPEWKGRAKEMMELAKYRCEECGDNDVTLQIHHKAYFKNRDPWDYEDVELRVLCKPCHAAEHVKIDRLKKLITHTKEGDLDSFLAGRLTFEPTQESDVKRAAFTASPCAYTAGSIGGMCNAHLSREQMLEIGAQIVEMVGGNSEALEQLAAIETLFTKESLCR